MQRNRYALIIWALAIAMVNPVIGYASECDNACLRAHIDRYLGALVKNQPAMLAERAGVRYTENGAVTKLGDGLWRSASGLGSYRQYFADAQSQQAMFMGTMREADATALLSLRVRVANERIVEAEHIVARKGSHPLFAPEAFVKPHSALSTPVAAADRLPRERLIAIA